VTPPPGVALPATACRFPLQPAVRLHANGPDAPTPSSQCNTLKFHHQNNVSNMVFLIFQDLAFKIFKYHFNNLDAISACAS
jgi:hypothetical protein